MLLKYTYDLNAIRTREKTNKNQTCRIYLVGERKNIDKLPL